MPSARTPRSGKEPQPRALIVTFYGLYARGADGWVSVRALIGLLAEAGVDAQAVRSAISRLKRRGVLVARTVEGLAGYALSDQAREMLREGDRRIFEPPRARRDDHWLLAVFSVPELERDRRHRLRSTLSWLGFGTVSSGVWIAPAHVEAEARTKLEEAGLDAYVDLFRSEHVGFRALPEQVAEWWDLDSLEQEYGEFLATYRPVRDAWCGRRRVDDAAAFADHLRLLTSWRRMPYLDPGLPAELLPADWPGIHAATLFLDLHERLASAAFRHVDSAGVSARPGPRATG